MDASENKTTNPRIARNDKTIGDIIDARLSRRSFLQGAIATSTISMAGCAPSQVTAGLTETNTVFTFAEITRGADEFHHIPEGYKADMLLRWGEAVFADAPVFNPLAQTAEAQERQFGYNNDFIGFYPLTTSGDRGLLCVNHEYTSTSLMFPNLESRSSLTKEECAVELAAHGGTIIEITKADNGNWRPILTSPYNRRITAGSTKMEITGPAAGSERLKTSQDPKGKNVIGTMNNCAGGITPWGTYLMAEENFNGNFLGELSEAHRESENHKRYGVPGGWYQWGRHFDRFDVSKEPNEPNRFGWVVEVDILDPNSTPKKRTALGRFKHEGAENVVAPNGKVVVYMGDDQRFDYVYKFVSKGKYEPDNRETNKDLLDDGVLYVARFEEDGRVIWLPLTYGVGPLTQENNFNSQADVLIEARRAGDLLGATPMDRPEDVQPNEKSGRVYVMLTNNNRRKEDQIDAANPRANNTTGHIIEIIEPEGDFSSTHSRWEVLVQCGDPSDENAGATWNQATSEQGWFGSPDNGAVDAMGRLWVSTDGNDKTGANDGVWALSTEGEQRGTGRAFFRAPNGAEVCGPRFTPDGKTLFVAVQHPGDGPNASFENPTTRWPDFNEWMPPRPSVLAISKRDGKLIGS